MIKKLTGTRCKLRKRFINPKLYKNTTFGVISVGLELVAARKRASNVKCENMVEGAMRPVSLLV